MTWTWLVIWNVSWIVFALLWVCQERKLGEAHRDAEGPAGERESHASSLPERPMHLAGDHIYPTPGGGKCRVRIYLPVDYRDAPVVICSELPDNGGMSVSHAAEQLVAEAIRSHGLTTLPVWIEHWPGESTGGREETFDLVVFSGRGLGERTLRPEKTGVWIENATWKRLDRASVEVLVGAKV